MRQGQTLAVLLVAVLIIVIVITLVWFSRQTPSGVSGTKGQTTYGAALQRAKEVECLNNLQQIRTAVQTYIATNGSNPPAVSAFWRKMPPSLKFVPAIASSSSVRRRTPLS